MFSAGRLGTGHIFHKTREVVKSENFNGNFKVGILEKFRQTRNSVKNDSGKSENLCIAFSDAMILMPEKVKIFF